MADPTTTYPDIAGVSPVLLREVADFPGGDHDTFVSRGCYDFTETHDVAVTIIPQYNPDDLSAPSGWHIELADEFTGVPGASATLGQTFDDPADAARHVTKSLNHLAENL